MPPKVASQPTMPASHRCRRSRHPRMSPKATSQPPMPAKPASHRPRPKVWVESNHLRAAVGGESRRPPASAGARRHQPNEGEAESRAVTLDLTAADLWEAATTRVRQRGSERPKAARRSSPKGWTRPSAKREGARARQADPRSNLLFPDARAPEGRESRRPAAKQPRAGSRPMKARLKAEPLPQPPARPDLSGGPV